MTKALLIAAAAALTLAACGDDAGKKAPASSAPGATSPATPAPAGSPSGSSAAPASPDMKKDAKK